MQHPDDNTILTLVALLRPHSLQKYSAIHKESLEECQASFKENEALDIVHLSHIRQKTGRIKLDAQCVIVRSITLLPIHGRRKWILFPSTVGWKMPYQLQMQHPDDTLIHTLATHLTQKTSIPSPQIWEFELQNIDGDTSSI